MMIRWADVVETYDQLYDKFKVNREYRERSWKTKESYEEVQKKLVEKIDDLDSKVVPEVEKIVKEAFPEAEVIVFDSRLNCVNERVIGRVLVKGLKSASMKLEMSAWFERKTAYRLDVDRFEDLPVEVQEKFSREERV